MHIGHIPAVNGTYFMGRGATESSETGLRSCSVVNRKGFAVLIDND